MNNQNFFHCFFSSRLPQQWHSVYGFQLTKKAFPMAFIYIFSTIPSVEDKQLKIQCAIENELTKVSKLLNVPHMDSQLFDSWYIWFHFQFINTQMALLGRLQNVKYALREKFTWLTHILRWLNERAQYMLWWNSCGVAINQWTFTKPHTEWDFKKKGIQKMLVLKEKKVLYLFLSIWLFVPAFDFKTKEVKLIKEEWFVHAWNSTKFTFLFIPAKVILITLLNFTRFRVKIYVVSDLFEINHTFNQSIACQAKHFQTKRFNSKIFYVRYFFIILQK